MNRTLCVLWLALLGAACTRPAESSSPREPSAAWAALDDGGTPPCPSDAGTCVAVEPEILPAEACPSNRWIGVLAQATAATCPAPASVQGGAWGKARLFEEPNAPFPLPKGLAGFCLYEWQGTAPPHVGSLLALHDGERLTALGRDCQVVAPLGKTAAVEAGWTTLHTSFHAQTGRVEHLPSDANHVPSHVRVAVVDSTPHGYSGGEAKEGRLSHGYVMGRLVRELGCPQEGSTVEPCVAQVANHLALPQVTPTTVNPLTGGYFGFQTQLARALHNAVSDWRLHQRDMVPAEPAQPRLVVNLSVAWEGRYGGAYNGTNTLALPPATRAVHAAVTHAVCRGALVIASAGNDPGGPGPVLGPMYPAAWEAKAAPTSTQCAAFEGPGYPDPGALPAFPAGGGASLYQPLLFAVGGVRADDEPLASTRPGGRPRLVAPGAHAVAVDDSSSTPKPTDVLTGTSVSAAVVSGTAATVWGYRPSLTAPELMALVRQSAVDLGGTADFCLGGSPCTWGASASERTLRRVSLCSALATACATGAEHCPASLPTCVARPAGSGLLPQLTASQLASIDGRLNRFEDGSAWNVSLPPLAVCQHAELRSGVSSYSETVCPFRQLSGAGLRPWTGPQPRENPCPLCRMTTEPSPEDGGTASTATLYLGIDSDFASQSLTDPTLVINGQYEVQLSGVALHAGDEVEVTGIPLDPAWGPVREAVLTVRGQADGGVPYSTMSELLVE